MRSKDAERSSGAWVSAYFHDEYNDGDPVTPTTGEELADLIDQVIAICDINCNFLTVYAQSANGHVIATLGVGVRLDGSAGAIRYDSSEGAYVSKGSESTTEPTKFFSYGHEESFPGNSIIDVQTIKRALIHFVDHSFTRPPGIQWQDWPEECHTHDEDCGATEMTDDSKLLDIADIDPWG